MLSPLTRPLLIVSLLVLSAGCQTATTPQSTIIAAPSASAVPSTAADTNSSVNSPVPQKATKLALSEEGLQLVATDTGSTRLVPFDTESKAAIAAVTGVRGEPASQSTNTECGAGPLEHTAWADGLTLYGSKGRFVGWSVNKRNSTKSYTTMAGVGVGSTRTELSGAYTIAVEQTSLGTEFSAGKLYGLLDGTGANAKVIYLWAGTSCNFR